MARSQRRVQVALLVQMLAPLLLAVDIFHNWYLDHISLVQAILLSGCSIWVAWTLFHFIRIGRRKTVSHGVLNFLLTIYASIFGLIALECGLRLIGAYTTLLP